MWERLRVALNNVTSEEVTAILMHVDKSNMEYEALDVEWLDEDLDGAGNVVDNDGGDWENMSMSSNSQTTDDEENVDN